MLRPCVLIAIVMAIGAFGAPAVKAEPSVVLIDWKAGVRQEAVTVSVGSSLVFHMEDGQDLTEVPEFVYDECASSASEVVRALPDFLPMYYAGEIDVTLPLDVAGTFFFVSSAGKGQACGSGLLRLRVSVVGPVAATVATPTALRQRRAEEPSGDDADIISGSGDDSTESPGTTTKASGTTTKSSGTTTKSSGTTTKAAGTEATTTGPPAPTSPDKESFRITFYFPGDFDTVVRSKGRFQDGIKRQLVSQYRIPEQQISRVTVAAGSIAVTVETTTQSAVDEINAGVQKSIPLRVEGVNLTPYASNSDAKDAEQPSTTKSPTVAATILITTSGTDGPAPTRDAEATYVTGEWLLPEDVPPKDVKKAVADILGKDEGDVEVTVTTNADGTSTAEVSVKKTADEDLVADLANDDFNANLAKNLQLQPGSVQTSKQPTEDGPQSTADGPKDNTVVIIIVICVVGGVILIALVAVVVMRRGGDRDSFTTTGSLAKMEFNNPVYESNVNAAAAPSGGADPFYASLRRKASVRLDNAAHADAEFEA